MAADIDGVLAGEYEAGFDGEDLTIVDIGANVGAFTIWAHLRWPNSRIHAYEPNPATFALLTENVAHLGNVSCHQQAVFPGEPGERLLFSRYPGDGEAGLVDYIGNTFDEFRDDRLIAVPTIDPATLPRCDVLKIDVEGGEAAILQAMDISDVSLILVEYQNLRNRRAIEDRLRDGSATASRASSAIASLGVRSCPGPATAQRWPTTPTDTSSTRTPARSGSAGRCASTRSGRCIRTGCRCAR
jgi:FkbM family methyltransferase